MKRLTIYAFYDPAGRVDDYVVDCVAAMSEYSERVLVVSNGELTADSLRRLTDISSVQVVERTNKGFDIWGYKYGLNFVGWSELTAYDEVVLTNSTIAGPLYPLSEMFDTMEARDVDFWGLTMHGGEDYDPWNLLPTGKLEPHLQSYFTVVRRPMLQSAEFREYWKSLPALRSYTEAVALHEAVFTHKFAELGFRWSTYVDSADLQHLSPYPLMFLPYEVLIEKRCPFFKRKALFLEAADLAATDAASTATMVECLDRLGYDLQRLLPNVIRTSNQSDVRLSLNTFAMLASEPRGDTADRSAVRVVAWVKDLASWYALERYVPVLEQCGDFVIVIDREVADLISSRLAGVKARIVGEAAFAQFVREVGHAAQTAEYLLVLALTGEFTGLPGVSSYVHYEAGVRALAGTDATLASAIEYLDDSLTAGALTSPLTSVMLGPRYGAWPAIADDVAALLDLMGIQVPFSSAIPAWGPPSGVVLAKPGMLAAAWDLVADAMVDLDEPEAAELFNSLLPFVLQSHGKLLVFALPETMAARPVFSSHMHTIHAINYGVLPKVFIYRARAARAYHKLERAAPKTQAGSFARDVAVTAVSLMRGKPVRWPQRRR